MDTGNRSYWGFGFCRRHTELAQFALMITDLLLFVLQYIYTNMYRGGRDTD